MTQEEKLLLLKDLSARLTYGVIVDYKENKYDYRKWIISTLHIPTYSENGTLLDTDYEGWINFTEYKGCGMSTGSRPLHLGKNLPFLRSMSSMTEEERNEWASGKAKLTLDIFKKKISSEMDIPDASDSAFSIDWLNKNMFDYRGLIGKGLALEAPKGMYNIKEK